MKQDAFSAGVEPGGLWHKNDIRILLCYILASVGAPLSRQDLYTRSRVGPGPITLRWRMPWPRC